MFLQKKYFLERFGFKKFEKPKKLCNFWKIGR